MKRLINFFLYRYKNNGKLFKYRYAIKWQISDHLLSSLMQNFFPYETNFSLIRLGNRGDGGYLLPDDFSDSDLCISAGCNAEWSFEKDLLDIYSVRSLILDEEDKKPSDLYETLHYIPKFLSYKNSKSTINLDKIINFLSTEEPSLKNLILKLDIESDEYPVLASIKECLISKFKVIVIEFHDIDKLRYKSFFNFFDKNIRQKLFNNFLPIHLHPNNCCGTFEFSDYSFPKVAEVTFINKKFVSSVSGFSKLPHKDDFRNIDFMPEVSIDTSIIHDTDYKSIVLGNGSSR